MKELFMIFRKRSDLDKIFDQTYEILGLEYTLFQTARQTLRESDRACDSIDVRAEDKNINAFQMEARRKIFTELTILGLEQLNAGLVLMNILIDVERIGDYCKNIVDLARNYSPMLNAGPHEELLQELEKKTIEVFSLTRKAFRDKDKNIGRKAMELHGMVSGQIDEFVNELIQDDKSAFKPNQAATLALYLRYLKRIMSHLTNIASSVVNPLERIGYCE